MQPLTAISPVLEHGAINDLLDVVETRMIEFVGANTSRVSDEKSSALAAAAYHLDGGGQRVRAKLALQAGLALALSPSDCITIATAVELLHNASLVHDDIQDRDEVRRDKQAVWVRFGVNTAICTGDLLLSAAYAALCKIGNPRALPAMLSLVHERTATAIDGQCADLTASLDCVIDTASGIARYQRIAIAKSGALLCLPIELALVASGHEDYLHHARHAVEAFAIGYQIVDDLNDVQSDLGSHASKDVFNIMSIYMADGSADNSAEKARRLGRQHLDIAIESAGRLPNESGALLVDFACNLHKLLVVQK